VPIDTDEGQIVCNLIAVHAGLEKSMDLNEQLRVLRTRDTRVPKVPMLSGRQDVWNIPQVSNMRSYCNILPANTVLFGLFSSVRVLTYLVLQLRKCPLV
jgi:hypothetical protein